MKIGRMIKRAYYRALGYYPITLNSAKYKLDPDHIKFWKGVAQGRWEPQTFTIFDKFINAGTVYCDIGAWIGPTVIYAAQKCKQVICFEPDPVAFRYLCWNVELNALRNVRSFNIALSDSTATRQMSGLNRLGDSTTSLLNGNTDKNQSIFVQTMTWEAFNTFSRTDKVDFIKMDIEGGEFALIPALKDYLSLNKPILYLSTHAPFLDADVRKEKLQQIIDVLGMYEKCFDHNLRPININELESEDARINFHSYIFMD